ncbi:MAG: AAA family ATPase [Myxococcota bacterium]|nr:AAA family ATPase [Myxococcota bacterium]
MSTSNTVLGLEGAMNVASRLRSRLRSAIVGRDEIIDLVIIALLADGHVLLEDYPGSGKTTLAKALGESLIDHGRGDIVAMRRVQFTPDLLPSDVTGTTIFDPEQRKFFFRPGPIFAHVLLADEINRSSPKVQSSLLEAMAEKQATIDNETHRLDDLFFVIATQNPLDLAGTYPLPTAQLDRFLFKICMRHIDPKKELDLLIRFSEVKKGLESTLPRVHRDEVIASRTAIENHVHIADSIKKALVDFAVETRDNAATMQGVSTRSLVLALTALQTRAMMEGRNYVSADDLVYLSPYLFAHRLMLLPGAKNAEEVVEACLKEPVNRLARAMVRR